MFVFETLMDEEDHDHVEEYAEMLDFIDYLSITVHCVGKIILLHRRQQLTRSLERVEPAVCW